MDSRRTPGWLGVLLLVYWAIANGARMLGAISDAINAKQNAESDWAFIRPLLLMIVAHPLEVGMGLVGLGLVYFGFGLDLPLWRRLKAYRGTFCTLWIGPIDWNTKNPPFGWSMRAGQAPFISQIHFSGSNIAGKEMIMEKAEIVSDITGERAPLRISTPGPTILIERPMPIPKGAQVALMHLLYDPNVHNEREGLETHEFAKVWGAFTLLIHYTGRKPFKHVYKWSQIKKILDEIVEHKSPHPRVG